MDASMESDELRMEKIGAELQEAYNLQGKAVVPTTHGGSEEQTTAANEAANRNMEKEATESQKHTQGESSGSGGTDRKKQKSEKTRETMGMEMAMTRKMILSCHSKMTLRKKKMQR